MKPVEQDDRWVLLTCGHVVRQIRLLPGQTGYRCFACRGERAGWWLSRRFGSLAEYYAAASDWARTHGLAED